ncbi:MAG: hypothetical protein A2Z20_12970 [Bdellovibrionales bacterium RBG_16_40_8]|nr:MAG: hypothetical protein A2Z20_12970 [Bdellovibrionales bacterium RBG_16_40_8]
MRKVIISALVLIGATYAQAGSVENLTDGMSNISKGLVGASSTTIKAVRGSVLYSADKIGQSATALYNTSVFVIHHPLQASDSVLDGSKNAITWTLDKSGDIVVMTFDGSKVFIHNPIDATSNAIAASGDAIGQAIEVTIDASGRVITASGTYLQNTYGDDMQLVTAGSGEIYTVTEGSVVFVFNKSGAAMRYVGNLATDIAIGSLEGSKQLKNALITIALSPAASFEASKEHGKQRKN